MVKFFAFMAIACASFLCCCATALAAETFVVEIQNPMQHLIGYFMAAVSGLVIGVVAWLLDPNTGKLAKLKIDDAQRAVIYVAINAGLKFAENQLRNAAKDIKNPTVQSEMLAIAVTYVLPRVPDALKHFGIDPTDLRDMILARFNHPDEKNAVLPS